MTSELTAPAERDIRGILRETLTMFGPIQMRVYAGIIDAGIEMVSSDPEHPASIARFELFEGVRLLHLEHAASRRGGAAHCLYYKVGRLSDGATGTIILRVLHERMDARHRVAGTLKA